MAEAVYLPKVGMTMEEGTLTRWLVADGAAVSRGQPLFEMETEKVQMEVEAEGEGLLKQLVPPETTLQPGDVVGCLLGAGEAVPASLLARVAQQTGGAAPAQPPPSPAPTPPSPAVTGERQVRATPIARRLAAENGIDLADLQGSGPDGRIVEQDVKHAIESRAAPAAPHRLSASPVARRLAAENGIDLPSIAGSGPDGRVVERDVVQAIEAAKTAAPEQVAAGRVDGATVPYSGRRRTIGERMLQSLRSMAQLTLVSETRVDEAVSMLHGLNREWRREGVAVTFTALVVRACALALREHPRLNARLDGDAIALLPQVNVGVAIDHEDGLMAPVVRDADSLPLKQVASLLRDLTERVKTGSLTLADVEEGSFTVTSLEGSGVDAFTPVINPPQVAILGIGRVKDGVGFEAGAAVRTQVVTLSLTFDHRVSDGAPAARFLDRVAELLSRPYLLM